MKRFLITLALLVTSLPALSYQTYSVSMRDNTKLTTFVVLHNNSVKPKPIMLVRTPYLSGLSDDYVSQDRIQLYAELADYFGAHLVLQAMRGTFNSEGTFRWLSTQEIEDAADTLEWISKQKFYNENIFALGVSYPGFGALATALTGHPSLKLIIAGSPPTNPLTDSLTAGGILGFGILDYIRYLGDVGCHDLGWYSCYGKIDSFKQNPNLYEYDNFLYGEDLEEWDYMLDNFLDLESDFWTKRGIINRLSEIDIPTIHIGGMIHDQDGRDALNNFLEVQQNSRFSHVHHLILGNWGHEPFYSNNFVLPLLKQAYNNTIVEKKKTLSLEKVYVSSIENELSTGDSYPIESSYHKNNFFLGGYGDNHFVSAQMAPGDRASTYQFNPNADQEVPGVQFVQKIEADLNINGMIELDLTIGFDTPQTDLYLNIYKWSGGNWEQLFITSFADRKRIYKNGSITKVHLQTPPLYNAVKSGDYLVYYIESGNQKLGYNAFLNHNVANDFYFEEFETSNIVLHHSFAYPAKLMIPSESPYSSGGLFIKGSPTVEGPTADWKTTLKEHRERVRASLVY